jgi:serine/threonine protein kinase
MVRCTAPDSDHGDGFDYDAPTASNGVDTSNDIISPNQKPVKTGFPGMGQAPAGTPPPSSSLVNGRYQLGSTIGKGNDGTVVRAVNVTTGKPLAIKITHKNRHNIECTSSESDNTRRSQSRNVVKVHEVLCRGDVEYLVMELAEMDLLELINALGCIDEDVAREYFRDMIHGLHSCHKVNVVHLDVKPDNLLIIDDGTTNGRVKLTDFGLSAYVGGQAGPVLLCQACGSNGYAPPEILGGNDSYDGRCADVWSSGIVLYACTQGQLPWDDACEECPEFVEYLNGDFSFPSNISPGLQALLQKILVVEPNKRATLEEIMADEWFRQGHQGSLSDSFSSTDSNEEDLYDLLPDCPEGMPSSLANQTASPCGVLSSPLLRPPPGAPVTPPDYPGDEPKPHPDRQ